MRGRETIDIPAGEEIQWDWFERRRAPWSGTAYVCCWGRCRIRAAPAGCWPRGPTSRIWSRPWTPCCAAGAPRVDRMATVIVPGSADVQASFAPVAKHYGAAVAPCPPRRGNRKGSVEAAVRFATGQWWRTLAAESPEAAQRSLVRFWSTTGDARLRSPSRIEDPPADGSRPPWPTVGELAEAETLLPLPGAPFPAVAGHRGDDRPCPPPGQRGVPGEPLLGGSRPVRGGMTLRHRLGTGRLEAVSPDGVLLVSHTLAALGPAAVDAHDSADPCRNRRGRQAVDELGQRVY